MSVFENFWIKVITLLIISFMTIFNLAGTGEVKTETAQINGSLSCTDSLGRSVISADGESEKLVGVFYFLWQNQHGSNRIIDISETKVFIIDCSKKSMPKWVDMNSLSSYSLCPEELGVLAAFFTQLR